MAGNCDLLRQNYVVIIGTVVAVISFLVTFGFALIRVEESLFWSRCYQMAAAVLMAVSTIRTATIMWNNGNAPPLKRSHLTDIIYLCLLAFISFFGYFFYAGAYLPLWNIDSALSYHKKLLELIFDLVFIGVHLVFVPHAVCYVLFFASRPSKDGITNQFLICTLLTCIFQKLIFESMDYRDHYCHAMEGQKKQECPGWHDTYKNKTDALPYCMLKLYQHYHSLGPIIYTCTLDFYIACCAVLYTHISSLELEVKHSEVDLKNLDDNTAEEEDPEFVEIDTQQLTENRSARPRLAATVADQEFETVEVPPSRQEQFALPARAKINCSYFFVALGVTLKFVLFFFQPLLIGSCDDDDFYAFVLLLTNYGELITHIACMTAFVLVWLVWHVRPPHEQSTEISHGSSHHRSEFSKEADLLILVVSLIFTGLLVVAKLILQVIAYWNNSQVGSMDRHNIILNNFTDWVLVISFFCQYRVIHRYLLYSQEQYEELAKHHFILILAPAAIIINVTRFLTIFANKQGFLPYLPASDTVLDSLLVMIQSAYPVPNIFSLTAAVCWAHITEHLAKANGFPAIYRASYQETVPHGNTQRQHSISNPVDSHQNRGESDNQCTSASVRHSNESTRLMAGAQHTYQTNATSIQ